MHKIGNWPTHRVQTFIFPSTSWINSQGKKTFIYTNILMERVFNVCAWQNWGKKFDQLNQNRRWAYGTCMHCIYCASYVSILFIYTKMHFNYQFKSFHLSWNFNACTLCTHSVHICISYTKWTIWMLRPDIDWSPIIGRMHKL